MANVFSRDGTWVVKWKDGAGRWRQKRTNCATKLEAKEFVRGLENKAQYQRVGLEPLGKPVDLTFSELLAWHKEQFEVGRRWRGDAAAVRKHLEPIFGSDSLIDVTSGRLAEALDSVARYLSPKTVNNLRAFVRSMFVKAAQRQLWPGRNPVEGVPRQKVPKQVPNFLKPEEVTALLPEVKDKWRPLFACAVYTGMRRGELLALQKRDVDLAGGTITVCRSWEANTTKGGHASLLPIHPELKPYLQAAIDSSPSALVFPAPGGAMHSRNVDLAELLRAALARAKLVSGWVHKCRNCMTGVPAPDDTQRRCGACGHALWPSPVHRQIRFHDLRHTTATLLLKAGVSLAVVQRVLRHTSPVVTAQVYGHLDLSDMSAALDKLSFGPRPPPEVQSTPIRLAVGDFGAPVVRNEETKPKRRAAEKRILKSARHVASHGPSWIRTRDQSVMSTAPVAEQGSTPVGSASLSSEKSELPTTGTLARRGSVSTVSTPRGAPVVRGLVRLLTVREVAEVLSVCRATVYALVERRELGHARVNNSIRIDPAELARFIARGGRQ